jgi:hypothetical protein
MCWTDGGSVNFKIINKIKGVDFNATMIYIPKERRKWWHRLSCWDFETLRKGKHTNSKSEETSTP